MHIQGSRCLLILLQSERTERSANRSALSEEQYLRLLWLVPLGFFAGGYGTVIGAGGGFILAPLLLLLYPDELPETVTCISLPVVFFNSLSGTLAYAKSRRFDYKSGIIFSVATTPGAVLGAIATSSISRVLFDPIVGLILLVTALLLALTSSETVPV